MARFSRIGLILAVGVTGLVGASAAHADTGLTTLVSLSSTGEQGNAYSAFAPFVSADGRFVAFTSEATNFVPDTNFAFDVFVRDRQAGETTRVSVSSAGVEGNGSSSGGPISADGRFVAFASGSTNLVAGDTNDAYDVFVHDRLAGVTERVSLSSTGEQADRSSSPESISADGRFVAFVSDATNLVPGDTNARSDIFVHDRMTGETRRVSVSTLGEQANDTSQIGKISADGRFVAFYSFATNLAPDTNGFAPDVYVHDLSMGTTERVSISSTGEQGNFSSFTPSISADGRFVAFASLATNLVGGDTNANADIFVRDRATGTTERVSLSTAGIQGNDRSDVPSISADGTRVAFESYASTLVGRDTNGFQDVFLNDRTTGETRRVSVFTPSTHGPGLQSNGHSQAAAISADGTLVAFASLASNLVIGDRNVWGDVFAHDLTP